MNTQDFPSSGAHVLALEMPAAPIAQSLRASEMLARVMPPRKAVRPSTPSPAFLPAEPEMRKGKLSSLSIGLHAQHRAEPA